MKAPTPRTARPFRTVMLAAAAFLTAAAAGAQTTIDDFSVAQAQLAFAAESDDPGDTASSTVAAGLGGERGMLLEFLEAEGEEGGVSSEVSGGLLSFASDAGVRGRLLLSWDGADGDPETLDVTAGLGGVDLTTGGHNGFRLLLNAVPTTGVELVIEVHSSDTESSRAAFVLPVLAEPTALLMSFNNDFAVTGGGGGADFTAVTAITLGVRAGGASVEISSFETTGPALEAANVTKTDTLVVDNDGDGLVDPGDTLRYTITIRNTGAEATDVNLNDVFDANTTLVPASISTTPVAQRDSYQTIGNVQLVVAAPGVLANDSDADGGEVAIDPSSFSVTSAQGSTVAMTADGGFTYTPPAGFQGVDSFEYILNDGDTPARTATGTVALVVEGAAWFVDNSHGGPSLGTQSEPFATLVEAQAAAGAGDLIRIRYGDGTTTGLDTGFILLPGQQLVGGGVDLVIGGSVVEAADGAPSLTAGGGVVTLAADTRVAGVLLLPTIGAGLVAINAGGTVVVDSVVINPSSTAHGIDLTDHSGTFTFSNSMVSTPVATTTTGTAVRISGGNATLDFSRSSSLQLTGGRLLDVSGFDGTLDLTGTGPTLLAGNGTAVSLTNNPGGSFTFDDIGSIVVASGNGIVIANSGTVDLDRIGTVSTTGGAALSIIGTTIATSGGPVQVSGLDSENSSGYGILLDGVAPGITVTGNTMVTDSGGEAVKLQNTTAGTFTFADLLVVNMTSNQPGLVATNNTGATLNVTTGAINTGSATAVDIDNTALGVSLQRVDSNGGTAVGIDLFATTGSFSVVGDGSLARNGSGGTITNKSGRGIRINRAENVSLASMNITNTGDDGIYGGGTNPGDSVNGFALRGGFLSNNGDAVNEHGLEFRDLHGTVVIDNTQVTGSAEDALRIFNDAGELSDLDIANSTFTLNSPALGNNGLNIEARGAARMSDIDIAGCTFSQLRATGVRVSTTDAALVDVDIATSTFANNNIAVDLAAVANSTLIVDVHNNPSITGHSSHAVNVFSGDPSAATISGSIRSNTIGTAGVPSSGSAFGNGLRLAINGASNATLTVDSNTIQEIEFGRGIETIARLGTGTASVAITNNTVRVNTTWGLAGIYLESEDTNTLCARITDNDVVGGPYFFGFGGAYLLNQYGGTFNLEGMAGDAATEISNTNTGTPVNTSGVVTIVPPGTCPQP